MRKKKNQIRLKLNENWLKYNGSIFVSVQNQRNFAIGDILKKHKNYFLVTKKGLKPIKEKMAFKKLIKSTIKENPNYLSVPGYFRWGNNRRSYSRPKQKIKVQHNEIYKKTPCYYNKCIMQMTNISITLHISVEEAQIIRDFFTVRRISNYSNSYKPEANERAKAILKKIVKNDGRLSIFKDTLVIRSINKKVYTISLKNGEVSSNDKDSICVQLSYTQLPLSDEILAKALTIAYQPEKS